jgi:uncharacterized membrane protein
MAQIGPTVAPPQPTGLAHALERNIAALADRKAQADAAMGWQERLAERTTRFAGSMAFLWLHLAAVGAWVAVNQRLIPGARPFDPTYVILATVASVEALFLSTFVLISQNRASAAFDRRAELDLQISLLAEHEVTRLIALTQAIARQVGVTENDDELVELKRDVAPEAVLDALERRDA